MSEIWKDIPNYQGLYQVSNYGNVRSLDHHSSDYFCKGRVLKPSGNGKGYLLVKLYKNGHIKAFRVHRIVANVFLPNHDKKLQVNHLDENKRTTKLLTSSGVLQSKIQTTELETNEYQLQNPKKLSN